jgi:Holliday junction DNA helicase RuvA
MIEYIKGELTELTPALAVVETAGVGYALNISLNTYAAVQGKKEVKLYVHEALVTGGRDDSFTLFGFYNKQERELYRQLITVSGVGANTARMILSSLTPAELCNVIANGDERMLKGVKGIGLKTAQRLVLELKDKIVKGDAASSEMLFKTDSGAAAEEASTALQMLGFSKPNINKAIQAILKQNPAATVEEIIKMALQRL